MKQIFQTFVAAAISTLIPANVQAQVQTQGQSKAHVRVLPPSSVLPPQIRAHTQDRVPNDGLLPYLITTDFPAVVNAQGQREMSDSDWVEMRRAYFRIITEQVQTNQEFKFMGEK